MTFVTRVVKQDSNHKVRVHDLKGDIIVPQQRGFLVFKTNEKYTFRVHVMKLPALENAIQKTGTSKKM